MVGVQAQNDSDESEENDLEMIVIGTNKGLYVNS